ncbi:MAG: hypothetical protein ACLUDF_04650 [Butyricicoccus sp.]
MQYEISNRMSDVHGSAIRELSACADPNMICGRRQPVRRDLPGARDCGHHADVMKNARSLFCSTVCPRLPCRRAIR